jgi:hypothetical protein
MVRVRCASGCRVGVIKAADVVVPVSPGNSSCRSISPPPPKDGALSCSTRPASSAVDEARRVDSGAEAMRRGPGSGRARPDSRGADQGRGRGGDRAREPTAPQRRPATAGHGAAAAQLTHLAVRVDDRFRSSREDHRRQRASGPPHLLDTPERQLSSTTTTSPSSRPTSRRLRASDVAETSDERRRDLGNERTIEGEDELEASLVIRSGVTEVPSDECSGVVGSEHRDVPFSGQLVVG